MNLEIVVEILILFVGTWPVLRFLSIPSIRREFFGIATLLAICLLFYTIGIIVVANYNPGLLRLGALLAAGGLIWERWRSRSSHGTGSGLPPGRLTLFPRRPWLDHLYYQKLAKRLGPIFKTSLLHRPMVCVHGAELGRELMTHHDRNLETIPVRFNRFIPRGFVRYMAPDDHRKYRQIFASVLSPEILRAVAPRMATATRSALAEMAANRHHQEATRLDPRDELRNLFFRVFAELFLAMPASDPDYHRLHSLYEAIDIRKMSVIPSHRDRHALEEIVELIRSWSHRVENDSSSETAPVCVLSCLSRENRAALDDETLIGNLVYIFHVGRADLTGLGVWVLKLLGDNSEWWQKLVDGVHSEARATSGALSSRIIKEALRLEQSEYLYRRARQRIEFRGFVIPEGWRVRILIREGHRDPRFFKDPEQFDPDRFLQDGLEPARFAPFGMGAHSCLGPHVTDAAMRIFLLELALGFDWQVVRDGPREYGWAHWQPSSKFRIDMREQRVEPYTTFDPAPQSSS